MALYGKKTVLSSASPSGYTGGADGYHLPNGGVAGNLPAMSQPVRDQKIQGNFSLVFIS
ncbi:hypothetical protein ACS25C_12270 [Dickeya undicola]|uniref:hypothetical protein n=1 Tax=Dickeya undicola TaxID=1577887 RepID=UPI001374ED47|nr:hypothetical protein [Dickeya undicola]